MCSSINAHNVTAITHLQPALVRRIIVVRFKLKERKISMNHGNPITSPEESRKFPVKSFLIALVILAATIAIFVFNVPVLNVIIYGLFGLMMFSHFFMHGSHGSHDHGVSPSQQGGGNFHSSLDVSQTNEHSHADGPARDNESKPKSGEDQDSSHSSGHSGCC